jgi:hypothetical protein
MVSPTGDRPAPQYNYLEGESNPGGSSGDPPLPVTLPTPVDQPHRPVQEAIGKNKPIESETKTRFYIGVAVFILAVVMFSPWTSKYVDQCLPVEGRGLWAAKGAIVVIIVLVLSLLL